MFSKELQVGHIAPIKINDNGIKWAAEWRRPMECTELTQFWVIFDPDRYLYSIEMKKGRMSPDLKQRKYDYKQ